MNYRHGYHAGNFADCMKHALLVWLVRALQRKPAGIAVLDTHAGAGGYDLSSEAAQRTGEWREGIGRVLEPPVAPVLAWAAAAVAVVLAVLLAAGFATRAAAVASGVLLLALAAAIGVVAGLRMPLDSGVLAAAGAAFALAALGPGTWSLDERREASSARRSYAPPRRR